MIPLSLRPRPISAAPIPLSQTKSMGQPMLISTKSVWVYASARNRRQTDPTAFKFNLTSVNSVDYCWSIISTEWTRQCTEKASTVSTITYAHRKPCTEAGVSAISGQRLRCSIFRMATKDDPTGLVRSNCLFCIMVNNLHVLDM